MGDKEKIGYFLKHKDNEVMYFEMDAKTSRIVGNNYIIDSKRLPFNLKYNDDFAERTEQLSIWIKARGLTGSRKDLSNIIAINGVKDEIELIIKSYGLNVTDHYWIHEAEINLTWNNMNCFNNIFDKIKINDNIDFSIDKNVKTPSPNYCVDGSIEKRWIINEKGERVLLKGSRHKIMQEPFNEVIAGKIMEEFRIFHVPYELKSNYDLIPYSECKTMADINNEYITANWVIGTEEYGTKEIYNHFIDICKNNGILDAKERLDEMIAIDFLIGNDDRHKGNFGILRNSDSLNWIKIAPIFDNGNSLFYDRDNESINDWGTDSLGKTFDSSNRLQLNVIDYPQWYNKSKGNIIIDIVAQELKKNIRLSDDRIAKIIEITKKRKDIFENIINKIK